MSQVVLLVIILPIVKILLVLPIVFILIGVDKKDNHFQKLEFGENAKIKSNLGGYSSCLFAYKEGELSLFLKIFELILDQASKKEEYSDLLLPFYIF